MNTDIQYAAISRDFVVWGIGTTPKKACEEAISYLSDCYGKPPFGLTWQQLFDAHCAVVMIAGWAVTVVELEEGDAHAKNLTFSEDGLLYSFMREDATGEPLPGWATDDEWDYPSVTIK